MRDYDRKPRPEQEMGRTKGKSGTTLALRVLTYDLPSPRLGVFLIRERTILQYLPY